MIDYKDDKNNKVSGINGRKLLEPQPFLPKKGNYRNLLVFKKSECIFDLSFYFAHHYFVARKDRTVDQVGQLEALLGQKGGEQWGA